jgi:hypothetical protein
MKQAWYLMVPLQSQTLNVIPHHVQSGVGPDVCSYPNVKNAEQTFQVSAESADAFFGKTGKEIPIDSPASGCNRLWRSNGVTHQ